MADAGPILDHADDCELLQIEDQTLIRRRSRERRVHRHRRVTYHRDSVPNRELIMHTLTRGEQQRPANPDDQVDASASGTP